MSRIGRDNGRPGPTHQLQAIHHAVRRSIAQFVRRGAGDSAPRALSDSYIRNDLESLAEATRDARAAESLSGSSLGGVAGLLSELNGVLAYASTLGDGVSDAQRDALQHRVNAIVGTIDRLSGGEVPVDSGSALELAMEIRRELLGRGSDDAVSGDPGAGTVDLAA